MTEDTVPEGTAAERDGGGRRLDAVGVGPQRTATTWLHTCLAGHPELCFPHQVKETFFLDRHFDRGWDWYWSQFGDCSPGTRRVEIAPSLFDVREATGRLRAHNPACRILASLRNPTERSISLWLHHWRKGRVGEDFRAAVRHQPSILEASRYARHLPRWIEAFGRERVHVFLVQDVAGSPAEVLKGVYRFLAVEPPGRPPPAMESQVYPSSRPRFPLLARVAARAARWLRARGFHGLLEAARTSGLREAVLGGGGDPPAIEPELRRELAEEFEEDVRYVEQLLGRDLPGWRST